VLQEADLVDGATVEGPVEASADAAQFHVASGGRGMRNT
jgi:hypothetical protein